MIYRLSAGHQYHPGYLCHLWHVPTQEPDSVCISITPSQNQRRKTADGPPSERGEVISFVLSFAIKSLYNLWLRSVCFHMPPKFHNSAALCCNIPCQHLSYQHIRPEGARCLLNLTFSGTLKHKLARSLCQMASVWSCIKQKPRNLRQVSEQGRTLSSLQPPPHLLYTHTPHPLTPTTICQKLSYKFLFVSIFKHDGEELSLYMRGRLCVYPAAPAPGNKRKPPLLLVEAGKGRRLRGWREER